MRPFSNADVASRFDAYPPQVRQRLLTLRELVYRTADTTQGVGEIEETLKWGEPAYLTRNRSGSTVRIDWKQKDPGHCAVYFNCQTGLVDMFRTLFPSDFRFEGNRALLIPLASKIPEDALRFCIAASLTYHLKMRQKKQQR